MSVETGLYMALAAAIESAVAGEPLFEVELMATVYAVPLKPRAIRIGDTNADLAPGPGGSVEELDVLGKVEILSQVTDDTPEAYISAREDVRAMEIATAQVFIDDPTMAGAVNDSRILGGTRGWGNLKGSRHAVAELYVIANQTGAVQ